MPSLREIAEVFGFSSLNGVMCHLKAPFPNLARRYKVREHSFPPLPQSPPP
jgi:hypothetical protein